MAITPEFFKLILKAGGSGRAVAAGYPDLLIEKLRIAEWLLNRPVWADWAAYRPDSAEIMRWHGVNLPGILDSEQVFKALGYTLDVFDIAKIRGPEKIIDLNYLIPWWTDDSLIESADLLVDSGTTEHCFNIGRAIINLAGLVKLNGHIVQAFPLNAINHGFYSVSPTLVYDFYGDNGFTIKECFGHVFNAGICSGFTFPIDPFKRLTRVPENSFLYLLAQRTAIQELKFPVQRKYRKG